MLRRCCLTQNVPAFTGNAPDASIIENIPGADQNFENPTGKNSASIEALMRCACDNAISTNVIFMIILSKSGVSRC
jgi:hypothetical protein